MDQADSAAGDISLFLTEKQYEQFSQRLNDFQAAKSRLMDLLSFLLAGNDVNGTLAPIGVRKVSEGYALDLRRVRDPSDDQG